MTFDTVVTGESRAAIERDAYARARAFFGHGEFYLDSAAARLNRAPGAKYIVDFTFIEFEQMR